MTTLLLALAGACQGGGRAASDAVAGERDAAAARVIVRATGTPRYPQIGPDDAPVTLALFSGPRDNMRQKYVARVQARHPHDVRVIWLFNLWPDELEVAAAALAAHEQGLFWKARPLLARLTWPTDPSWARQCQAGATPTLPPLSAMQPLVAAGVDLERFARDMQRVGVRRRLIRQWRVAQALGLARAARWMGGDFVLVNGRRLLPRRPGFTPAEQAIARLERMVREELARADRAQKAGTPRHLLSRELSKNNGAAAFVDYVLGDGRPPRAAALLIDPDGLPSGWREQALQAAARVTARPDDPLALTVMVAPDGGRQQLGAPPPPSSGRWFTPKRPIRSRHALGRMLIGLVEARDLAADFHRRRRVLVVTGGRLRARDLRPALRYARVNGYALDVFSAAPLPDLGDGVSTLVVDGLGLGPAIEAELRPLGERPHDHAHPQ